MTLWPLVVDLYLGPEHADSPANVHLLDPSSTFIGGIGAGPFWQFTSTGFQGSLVVRGDDAAEAHDTAALVTQMVNLARRRREGIILSLQLSNGEWRYLDVMSGDAFAGTAHGNLALVTLTLECLPYARGDSYAWGPTATVTNGEAVGDTLEVLGDAPALVEWLVTDESSSGNIERIRLGARVGSDAATFTPIVEPTAIGAGYSATDDTPNYLGSDYVQTIPGSDWQAMAGISRTPSSYVGDLLDVYARIRDNIASISAPTITSAIATGTPPLRYSKNTFNSDNTTSTTITFTKPLPGSLLTLIGGYDDADTASTPAGWTARASNNNGNLRVYAFEKIADGTETGVTISFSGTVSLDQWHYAEWVGMTSSPFDKSATGSGTGSTSVANSATAALAQAHELVIAGFTGVGDYTPGSGYTSLMEGSRFHAQYRTTSATTAVTASATKTGTSAWAGVTLTYRFNLYGSATSTVPNLTAATYSYAVAAKTSGGGLGELSTVGSAAVAANGYLALVWNAPSSGTPAGYRVFWNRGAGWYYRDTSGTERAMVLWTETGGTSTTLPTAALGAASLIRLRYGLATDDGGVTPANTAQLVNGVWEWVYLGPVPDSTYFTVEAKASGSSSAALDIDALAFLPHDEHQVEAPLAVDLSDLNLGVAHDWTLGADRYGHRYGRRALSSAPTVPVAGVRLSAPPLLHPGEVQPIVLLEGALGVADIDLGCTLSAIVTPRYRYRGNT